MRALPEAVWTSLIRAVRWPEWYFELSKLRFVRGSPPDLAAGTRFRWRTFGLVIDSTVMEFGLASGSRGMRGASGLTRITPG